jgi:magnesium transporter
VIVDCAHYVDGRRQSEGRIDLDVAAEVYEREDDHGFVWIALFEPDVEELAELQHRFGLHDLAVEDAQTFHLRPKVEQYEEGHILFAVIRTAHYVDEEEDVQFGEVSIFLSRRFLITVRHGVASELGTARRRLESRPELLKTGPAAGLWAILDKIVDDYAPVIAGLENDVEQVEGTVFRGTAAATERIYKLRREATDFYRAVHPLLGPLDALERAVYPQIDEHLVPFFRDINDHLKLVNEEVVGLRDILATVLQANIAVISLEQNDISVRQNATTKQLTVIATTFLPLSFLTGFFGQNFGWLVNHITSWWAFLVFGIGSMAASCALLFAWFHRTGLARPDHPE